MDYSSDIKRNLSQEKIEINSCGELRINYDSHIMRQEGRNDYQLIYICEGYCIVNVNGNIEIAYPGDCIIYRPGERQDYLLAKKAQPRTYWIHFNGIVCQEMFEKLALQSCNIVRTAQNREIEHLISRICKYYNLKISNYELICSGLMQSALALISNEFHGEIANSTANGADKISELISRIKMVPNLRITVSECADFCCMSKPHFTRTFKKITGMAPMQFILSIRIERAKELLNFTDKSITDISEASGFGDQNYFARIFKKTVGITPTQYRKTKV